MSPTAPYAQAHGVLTSLEAHVVERERKVLSIVEALLATPVSMRATDVAVHCGNDIHLLRRVERLLEHAGNGNGLWLDRADVLSVK